MSGAYSVLAGSGLLKGIPKEVWASIAVSFIVNGQGDEESTRVRARILHEWELLYEQGLVIQKPNVETGPNQPGNDAQCLACGFRMQGGANVGRCPRCGSGGWHKTRLA